MVPAFTDDVVVARVQGIPTDQVLARILCVGETLVDVFVKWRGLSITSTSRRVDVISNVTRRLQQERVYRTLSFAIMHWAFKPSGPLQRLCAAKAKLDFDLELKTRLQGHT